MWVFRVSLHYLRFETRIVNPLLYFPDFLGLLLLSHSTITITYTASVIYLPCEPNCNSPRPHIAIYEAPFSLSPLLSLPVYLLTYPNGADESCWKTRVTLDFVDAVGAVDVSAVCKKVLCLALVPLHYIHFDRDAVYLFSIKHNITHHHHSLCHQKKYSFFYLILSFVRNSFAHIIYYT